MNIINSLKLGSAVIGFGQKQLLKKSKFLVNSQPIRSYKNFGHKPEREPLITKLYCVFLTSLFYIFSLDWNPAVRYPDQDDDVQQLQNPIITY